MQYFSCKDRSLEHFRQYQADFLPFDKAAGPIRGETGRPGLQLDFNCGLRLAVPQGDFFVRISDSRTGAEYFAAPLSGVWLISLDKYFVPWHVEVYEAGTAIFVHDFNPDGQQVHFHFGELMGDSLAFLPYVQAFQRLHGCHVSARVPAYLREVFLRCCPGLEIREQANAQVYATFFCLVALSEHCFAAPLDVRQVPLAALGMAVLGMFHPYVETGWRSGERKIKEPYVCIGVQASGACKGWHFPGGWEEICIRLQAAGYRVLCIDGEGEHTDCGLTIRCPEGAEDLTGRRPLLERAELLSHAACFIGLCSGLAWLARTVRCPAVMIGGFSNYWAEFPEAYRVSNPRVCQGCYNDTSLYYVQNPCARQERESDGWLQCSKSITVDEVWQAVTEALL